MGWGDGGPPFRDQILGLGCLFDSWSEAERVVAIYALLRRLRPIPSRFLANCLAAVDVASGTGELAEAERRANNAAWVSQIGENGNDTSVSDLLSHLPLLRANNSEAKTHYLTVIPKVLTQALTADNSHQPAALEQARQVLSYALIHPAIGLEERRSLAQWLRLLEERWVDLCFGGHNSHSSSLATTDEGYVTSSGNAGRRSPSRNGWSETGHTGDFSQEDPAWSLPSGQGSVMGGLSATDPLPPLLSPNQSVASSRSSLCEFDENTTGNYAQPGMRDVSTWLKSLRLHKYAPLLCSLKYSELISLDETFLESHNVTLGARHKIVLSVAKLRERSQVLMQVEKDVAKGGDLTAALEHLKSIILTPFPPPAPAGGGKEVSPGDFQDGSSNFLGREEGSIVSSIAGSQEDLPSQFTRVLGKVCTQLLVGAKPDDESFATFLALIDRCLSHEAFECHSRRLQSWRQQVVRVWHPAPSLSKGGKDPRGGTTRRWSHHFASGESLLAAAATCRAQRGSVGSATGALRHHAPPHWGQAALWGGLGGGKFYEGGGSLPPFYPILPLVPPTTLAAGSLGSLGALLVGRNSFPGLGTTVGGGGLLTPQQQLSKRPSLQEVSAELRHHSLLHRTRSAPSRPHQLPLSCGPPSTILLSAGGGRNEPHCGPNSSTYGGSSGLSQHPQGLSFALQTSEENDISDRLESLCLSMTEHALG